MSFTPTFTYPAPTQPVSPIESPDVTDSNSSTPTTEPTQPVCQIPQVVPSGFPVGSTHRMRSQSFNTDPNSCNIGPDDIKRLIDQNMMYMDMMRNTMRAETVDDTDNNLPMIGVLGEVISIQVEEHVTKIRDDVQKFISGFPKNDVIDNVVKLFM